MCLLFDPVKQLRLKGQCHRLISRELVNMERLPGDNTGISPVFTLTFHMICTLSHKSEVKIESTIKQGRALALMIARNCDALASNFRVPNGTYTPAVISRNCKTNYKIAINKHWRQHSRFCDRNINKTSYSC